jgi:hypothetical protein
LTVRQGFEFDQMDGAKGPERVRQFVMTSTGRWRPQAGDNGKEHES